MTLPLKDFRANLAGLDELPVAAHWEGLNSKEEIT
jgi:hypothetical protein